MAVNYNDERFQNVESQEKQALQSANNMYDTMINNSDKYYNDMAVAAEDYGKKQAQIQQANTDFAIQKIEQQKDQAAKDYTKEQKGAYADWQRQSNQYGANAEQMAASGLVNTGYSESSQVSMYNTYQNRVSQARDTYGRAVLEYDNGIKEAQLSNNAALAEIAYQALQTKLKLGLDQFQYKNELLNQKLQTQRSISSEYYGRWQDVLNQINTENALAEQKRQFNKTYSARGGNSPKISYEAEIDKENTDKESWLTRQKNKVLSKLKNAADSVGKIETDAGKKALDYLKNFKTTADTVGGVGYKQNVLSVSDWNKIKKYLGQFKKGEMTKNDEKYIDTYINNNFR